ncbi:hypothetical protein ACCC92_03130 [Mucilaginibacter sp. Mucisp84]|uniref:hypothetical protein n=1 Tax=Mucilaginibacter sp. Mucisp84 TaxID=3243058 RepID=UPI0039A4D066
MWKKIRSNRDPADTLYSEIRKEFDPYFQMAGRSVHIILQKFPKGIFGLMVIMMILSMVLTFTVFRRPEPKTKPVARMVPRPLHDGFDEILHAGAQLKETIRLKKIVDSITAKKQLNAGDSSSLVKALDTLQKIHPSLK